MPDPTALWRPSTEAELLRAAADQQLDEATVGMEFKERLADGRAGNLKLAQEIASLAVDGGAIVVGVVDPKNRVGSNPVDALSPVKLDGLVERVESVARSVPDPPIPVSCRVITSDRDLSTGYVVP